MGKTMNIEVILLKIDTYYVSMKTIDGICHNLAKQGFVKVDTKNISEEQILLSANTDDSDEGVRFFVAFLDELKKVEDTLAADCYLQD